MGSDFLIMLGKIESLIKFIAMAYGKECVLKKNNWYENEKVILLLRD